MSSLSIIDARVACYVLIEDYLLLGSVITFMQIGFIRNDLFYVIIGTILGFIITRNYYKKMNNYGLGKRIESIMLSKSVEEIASLINDLVDIVNNLQIKSNDILDQIKYIQDIEKIPYTNNLKSEIE